VHEHASEELLLEVTLLRAHAHIVEGRCEAPLDQAIENVTDRAQAMRVILTRSRLQTNGLLLPVLECLCLVEILHPVQQSGHQLARVFLIEVSLSDGVP